MSTASPFKNTTLFEGGGSKFATYIDKLCHAVSSTRTIPNIMSRVFDTA